MNIYENTIKATELLINNCFEIQKKDNVIKLRYDQPKHFLKEYATVKVYGPRQSGHSSAIVNIICKFELDALVISLNQRMMEFLIANSFTYFQETYKPEDLSVDINKLSRKTKYMLNGNEKKIYYTCSSFLNNQFLKFMGESVDAIIIDTASFFKNVEIEYIYDFAVKSGTLQFSKNPLILMMQ